jgi:hypothetical protein
MRAAALVRTNRNHLLATHAARTMLARTSENIQMPVVEAKTSQITLEFLDYERMEEERLRKLQGKAEAN